MNEAATQVILARAAAPPGFNTTIAWSVTAHVGLVLFFVYMPDSWRGQVDQAPRTIMTISLGGAPGPRAGGMTQMGGRTVQVPMPAEPLRRADAPPAAAPPAMTLPREDARPRPRPQPRPDRAVADATGQTPTTGAEPQEGPARVDTRARGQGFGLTTGGGGGTGVQLDVGSFCCPEYLEQMTALVQRNWTSQQGVAGATTMKFTITRGGAIEQVAIELPSGFVALDLAAQRALLLTRLPELPVPFPNPSLTIHMKFEYSR
ncbi:MAG: TonB C-terminal domain-containing protein [Acidobacteria bacterium]|nr:TonB C-terminal domain-containing protein [Acidobacteriota bacterium]